MQIKPQDIVFIVTLLTLLFVVRKPKWFVIAGLICLVLAIPLFSNWIFFTAQRLTIYAFLFFFIAVLLNLLKLRKS